MILQQFPLYIYIYFTRYNCFLASVMGIALKSSDFKPFHYISGESGQKTLKPSP